MRSGGASTENRADEHQRGDQDVRRRGEIDIVDREIDIVAHLNNPIDASLRRPYTEIC
jgi:hypothetical protein